MAAEFRSEKEFRTVMDRVFSMMSEDPDMGPKLRDADVPQRFEFTDFDLVVNIRAAQEGEDGNLHWEWSDDVDWSRRSRWRCPRRPPIAISRGKRTSRWRSPAGASSPAATSRPPSA